MAFVIYLKLRWQSYFVSLVDFVRHRSAWLLLPIFPYLYLLSKDGDFAIPWLPYFLDIPALTLLSVYTICFLIFSLPTLSLVRPPAVIKLFACVPISLRTHQAGDAFLVFAACFPFPLLLFSTALISWLHGGLVSGEALVGIGILTLSGQLLFSFLMWFFLQCWLLLRFKRYKPSLGVFPIALSLPLNATFALLPTVQLHLFYGLAFSFFIFLGSVTWHFSVPLTMLVMTCLQFATRAWQAKLLKIQSLLNQKLRHWPLTNIRFGVAVLAFSPYVLFQYAFLLIMLFAQPVNAIPLIWLCVISFLHCMLLNNLDRISREAGILLQGFDWVLCLAFISELIG